MKLVEITSTITKKPTNLDMDNRDQPHHHGISMDDTGYFSFVKPDEEDPHMIRKYHRRPDDEEDAFDYYVEELRKRKLWNKNIHFPRIYNTNVHQGYKDWTIEKLINTDDVSNTEYRALIKRYFSGANVDSGLIAAASTKEYIPLLLRFIRKYTSYEAESFEVEDEELSKALDILRDMVIDVPEIDDFDWGFDNIMFRRTSVGLQLVFTDPFGFTTY